MLPTTILSKSGTDKKKKVVSSLGLNNSLVESLNTSQILSCIHRFPVILLLTIKFKTKPNKNIPRLLLKKQEFDKKSFVVSENLHHIEDDCCVHSSNFYGSRNRVLLCILNNFSVFYLEFFNQVWATGIQKSFFHFPCSPPEIKVMGLSCRQILFCDKSRHNTDKGWIDPHSL